jgi:hypothetical protein
VWLWLQGFRAREVGQKAVNKIHVSEQLVYLEVERKEKGGNREHWQLSAFLEASLVGPSEDAGNELDGAYGVVVSGDGVGDDAGVDVRANEGDGGDVFEGSFTEEDSVISGGEDDDEGGQELEWLWQLFLWDVGPKWPKSL